MAAPLSKIHIATGAPYKRPADIERAVDQALLLPREELRRRIAINTPEHPDYVPSEVLVHLVRLSRQDNSEASFNRLYNILVARVTARLPKGKDDVDAFVRQNVLDVFVDRVCEDRRVPGHALDFAECRFAAFVANLAKDARDKYRRSLGRESALGSDEDEDGFSRPVREKFEAILDGRHGDFDDPNFRKEFCEAISLLKPEQRRQAMLIVEGLNDASGDPTERTIASTLGISDRQVRNRKQGIVDALRRIMIEEVEL